MKISYNSKMRIFLNKKLANIENINEPLPSALYNLLSRGIECIDDCVYLKANISFLRKIDKNDLFDKTGLECFVNKITLDEYVSNEATIDEIFETGVSALNFLKTLLYNESGKFLIIFGIQHDNDFLSGTLRFHKYRPGESWLSDNLEGYEESILVVHINKR